MTAPLVRTSVADTAATVEPSEGSVGSAKTSKPATTASTYGRVLALVAFSTLVAGSSPQPFVELGSYTGKRRRMETTADSSTAHEEVDPALAKRVRETFEQATNEFFEDGTHSTFSRSLLAMVDAYGRTVMPAISEYVFSLDADPEVVSEALRWIADSGDRRVLAQLWMLLGRTLKSWSPKVRDSAILGFATLDDAGAIRFLADAQQKESIPEIRELIGQVMTQLATRDAATPSRR